MNKKHYIIPIFVPHEGCPHDCVFCNQDSITGSSDVVDSIYVRETIEEYLRTIENNKHEASIIEVSFFGGTFTAIDIEKQRSLLGVAKEYKDSGRIHKIRLSTRPDAIDILILEHLKKYSVDIIELGVQSLDDEVLIKSGRGHDAKQVESASRLIKNYGITLGHQIMLGLPGDNLEKDIETTKKVISMKPHICRIYPALTVKNTPMEKMYFNGLYVPYSLEEAVNISKIIYGMLTANNIGVIRLGLQTTEEINEGAEIVAGPFHQAFRELVEANVFVDMIEFIIKDNAVSDEIVIYINKRDISKLYANGKSYFNKLKERYSDKKIIVIQEEGIPRKSIKIKSNNLNYELSEKDFLQAIY
ncbi:MAG: radical SAM protein [Clostridium sp.]